ncbi:MAG TPA: DNA-processing protein DprA [Rhodocyclaceae bacterium]|nr:DNA-processing protein DprA [Rhodocyclaceae bacterium]
MGGATQRTLLAAFGDPEAIFSAPPALLDQHIGVDRARALLAGDCAQAIDAALAWASERGNHIIVLGDPNYPPSLLDIPDPPTLLYVKGDPGRLAGPALAIVGARNCTPQGASNAEAFARALSAAGVTIVSGLAVGIDTAAHRGGLAGPGGTVAVIGTGADRIYPARNEALAREISAGGAIVSEFPLGTPPLAANLPRRNRLLAGLSAGVLVVEAALRSGSLITARLAAEQGRDVFALPGSIHAPLAKGCHRLIKDGAKLVDTIDDILTELRIEAANPHAPAPTPARDDDPLMSRLGDLPQSIDQLALATGLPAAQINVRLLELELAGLVASVPGGLWQRLSKT